MLNTNDFKASNTSNGAKVMQTTNPGVTLVDVLDPNLHTYPVAADGTLRISPVNPQQGMILVPQAQVTTGQ